MQSWLRDSLRCSTCGDLPTQGRSELGSDFKTLQRLNQETKLATFLKQKGPAIWLHTKKPPEFAITGASRTHCPK